MEANLLNRNGSIGAAPGEPAGKKARSRSGQAHAKAGTAFKAINLALQGGGAHGAFTWGVLDRLLEDERIVIEGISATSAGAMNATVAAYGMPLIVELGIFFDVLVAVLIIGIYTHRIQDAFDSVDTSKLTVLKD